MKKVIFISIFIISLVVIACSSVPPTDLPPTVDIKNSKVSFMQDNMEQQSSSFHHFLMGRLLKYFEGVFIDDTYNCRVGRGVDYGVINY